MFTWLDKKFRPSRMFLLSLFFTNSILYRKVTKNIFDNDKRSDLQLLTLNRVNDLINVYVFALFVISIILK